ncbi:MAG: hypothetical protein HRT87_02540 [Legionellales bacterium]|nr:hypothetical protein [Legionellales bacterium]
MRVTINSINIHPIAKYILGGIFFVLAIYILYALFFVAVWGILIGIVAFCAMSLKNFFSRNKADHNKPIIIEHKNNREK